MKKPKVAILTLPLHTNFGGNLQAYALSVTLNKLGCETTFLNQQNTHFSKISNILNVLKQLIKVIILNKAPVYRLPPEQYSIIRKNHINFIQKHMNLSEILNTESELKGFIRDEKFDFVIVGSDQVWRDAYVTNIETYFLNFIKDCRTKKIAYAASFGLDYWQYSVNKTKKIKELVKEFEYVSVREDIAVKLCKSHLDIEVDHVLDPTLLLKKDEYIKLIDVNQNHSKGKIFTYILDESADKLKLISRVSKDLHKDIYSINTTKYPKNKKILNNPHAYTVSKIEDWLESFHGAEYVITDSFHGMVFSIIFNKKFIVIPNMERGLSRFTSLLKLLSLSERLVDLNNFDETILYKEIDYERINSFLELERNKAISILNRVLFKDEQVN